MTSKIKSKAKPKAKNKSKTPAKAPAKTTAKSKAKTPKTQSKTVNSKKTIKTTPKAKAPVKTPNKAKTPTKASVNKAKTPAAPKPTTPVVTKNRVAIVVDRSGSMQSNRRGAVSIFNNIAETIKKNARKGDQETEVSLSYFNNDVEDILVNEVASSLKAIAESSFQTSGGTALFDAVIQAIKTIERTQAKDTAYAVVVLTDGEENTSLAKNPDVFRALLQKKMATDLWTFAFMVPHGYKARFLSLTGLPEGNVEEWADIRHADTAATAGISQYYADRRAGKTHSKNFFVQTDLSKVSKAEIRKLDDVSGDIRILNVEKESDIREFVESKGLTYTKGCAAYQLTKPEEVQDYKEIYLVKKGTKTVLAGARQILGMPSSGTAKVVPGNHADYDIFVLSTSFNRKLVRGTKLLFIKTI